MKYIVTGAAGFIGFFVSQKLLAMGHEVLGIDNINDYYDPSIKEARLTILKKNSSFNFERVDITESEKILSLFRSFGAKHVVHLAAQAGVRYCVKNPYAYTHSNLVGFLSILEACRHHQIEHLVYASTSSVYGLNTKVPFTPHKACDHPVSLYGATKKANELMAHSYGHMFSLPTTGLRFFTVYGPWGRPDMALFQFTKNILAGKPIEIYNYGNHKRDFTYVEDICEGVVRIAVGKPPGPHSDWNPSNPDPSLSSAPYRIYNIGNGKPEPLLKYIDLIESELDRKAIRKELPMQAGDILETHADVSDLERDYDYHPSTTIEVGVKRFIQWYKEYYKI